MWHNITETSGTISPKYQQSRRDVISSIKSDYFAVLLSPYNDGINAVEFIVSAAGVQGDINLSGYNEDSNWDAVWISAIQHTSFGWMVEIKIPYSALRFSTKQEQTWGINFMRRVKSKNELQTWSPIDNGIKGITNQLGTVTGISELKPPIRLAFYPYLSGYYEKLPTNHKASQSLNGGMDIKVGISKSFTLDAALIPDFGQVQSDDQVYNLSPFEVQYAEKRQFFIEGMDLFKRGGIFYSRRIGGTPTSNGSVSNNLLPNEIITENPSETKLINGIKVSGRTSGGLGVGLLNAITAKTEAAIEDTVTGIARTIQTQGLTNYNIIVFDQNLKNNSYISLINTHVYRRNDNFNSNVTATEFLLRNRANSLQLTGIGAYSRIDNSELINGYKYQLRAEKTSGTLTYGVSHNTESEEYNPNALGYLQAPNEFTQSVFAGFKILKPTFGFRSLSSNFTLYNSSQFAPRVYTSRSASLSFVATEAAHYFTFGGSGYLDIENEHNYYEARVPGRMVILPKFYNIDFWISSDYRKFLAIDATIDYTVGDKYGANTTTYKLSPRLRFSDKLFLVYSYTFEDSKNSIGLADNANDPIIFATRDISTYVNVLENQYVFNSKSFVSLRARHYIKKISYNDYYALENNGTLSNTSYNDLKDKTYTNFYIDLSYQWTFAPGSTLSLVWKNTIVDSKDYIRTSFMNDLRETWSNNQGNSFSIKFIYYIDYLMLTKRN
ncbi:DUF5916 domain-containing protein [Williamwhitmania taraxaci]|uniref:DUF5916 domain-containing protein n=1 Tax=Williamwhitmania taraxaci TaxID=1640674 RepID=A0A1G6HKG0_9BACT|nr:DUF5916 domain-containing protein [Williamwhitmania taraxaci]SDB94588.1 hypothetical protein SAMN05216323_101176 [Williamwhitmania taraxaci]